MADFWFKFYGTEFLMNARIQNLPLEAQAILVRCWSVCCSSGYVAAGVEGMAADIRLKASQVAGHYEQVAAFFQRDGDRLVSPRMESDRQARQATSKGARKAADRRWEKDRSSREAIAIPDSHAADAHADADAFVDADADAVQSSEFRVKELEVTAQSQEDSRKTSPADGGGDSGTNYSVPCLDRNGQPGWWLVRDVDLQTWQRAFPEVNIQREILALSCWLEKHPERRRSFDSVGGSILNWLGKARPWEQARGSACTSRTLPAAGVPSRTDEEHAAQFEEYAKRQEEMASRQEEMMVRQELED